MVPFPSAPEAPVYVSLAAVVRFQVPLLSPSVVVRPWSAIPRTERVGRARTEIIIQQERREEQRIDQITASLYG